MSPDLFLLAQLAGRPVAVNVAQVESVVDIDRVVPVPGALPGIAGLAALRSRVVTVVDTHAALGLPTPAAAPARAIVTKVEGHLYALLVDALDDVAAYPARPRERGASGWDGAGTAVIDRDGEPVLAIDLAQLVPGAGAGAA
jgi:purine-binding chemotaxis protein CheW